MQQSLKFSELSLSPSMSAALEQLGFETATPIQAQAIPALLNSDTDFLGLAATGTGKTLAFGIPLLEKIRPEMKAVQAVVLCPTRELAIQVAGQIDAIAKKKGITTLAVFGGAGFMDQVHAIKRSVHVLVATPGRLVDHLTRGHLSLAKVHTVVLDEADEMISMGFKDDLEAVLENTNEHIRNIWLFSATMSSEVRKVADHYMNDPITAQVNRTEMLSGTVEQIFYVTKENNKPEVLCKLIDVAADFYGLVFCQTKALVMDLTQYLRGAGYPVECLHGDMDQNARERAMKAFRDRKISILVCTDVASRGLDVKELTHVINYSIPRELDSYVHRIGRTGRNGRKGLALSLVTTSHMGLISRIEKMTKTRMQQGTIPTRKEIGMKKVTALLGTFSEQTAFARASELLGEEWIQALDGMEKSEIASRFITLLYPEMFKNRAAEPTENTVKIRVESDDRQGRRPGRDDRRRDDRHDDRRNDNRDDRRGPRHEQRHEGRRDRFKDRGSFKGFGGQSNKKSVRPHRDGERGVIQFS